MGFGLFNVVEGLVNHHLLGPHHVNETVPQEHWIYWDVGFLVWGAAMLVGGWALWRAGQWDTAKVMAQRSRKERPPPGPAHSFDRSG
jgi:uncharacterized membrane protein